MKKQQITHCRTSHKIQNQNRTRGYTRYPTMQNYVTVHSSGLVQSQKSRRDFDKRKMSMVIGNIRQWLAKSRWLHDGEVI